MSKHVASFLRVRDGVVRQIANQFAPKSGPRLWRTQGCQQIPFCADGVEICVPLLLFSYIPKNKIAAPGVLGCAPIKRVLPLKEEPELLHVRPTLDVLVGKVASAGRVSTSGPVGSGSRLGEPGRLRRFGCRILDAGFWS